ncbi:MAG: hypothetical protein E6I73_15635 [Chloroflexi bacterium]|nr:MAG: hypothetical protein E6I73_15635 [Chloroflexota bacterium]
MPETPKPAAAGTNHRTHRLREFVLLTLGVITPVGILAVNASAFVMSHLDAFRIVIAGCALLSGLVLNGLTAWWLLRLASLHAPPLFREYRTWIVGAAVLIVILTAAGGGYLTYLGLRDPRRLPDSLSMIVAAFMLLLPFAVTFAGRRLAGIGGIIPVDEPAGRERARRSPPSGRPLRGGPTSPQAGK